MTATIDVLVAAAIDAWSPGLGPRPRREGARIAVHAASAGSRQRLLCSVWATPSTRPSFVAKLARVGDGGIPAEHEALRRLRRWGIPSTPLPICRTVVDGACAGLESEMDGRALRALVQERPRSQAGVRPLETVGRWLERLHLASCRSMVEREAALLLDEPLRGRGIGDLTAGERDGLARLRAAARSLDAVASLPVVFVHGDLGTTNVLVDEEGRLTGVVDWETAAWGLPLTDLLYLVDALGADLAGAGSFARSPSGVAGLDAVARRAIDGSARRLGIAPGWLPVLRAAMLVGHAAHEAAAGAPAGSPAPFRARLRVALLEASRVPGIDAP